jgi:hypothetical protein
VKQRVTKWWKIISRCPNFFWLRQSIQGQSIAWTPRFLISASTWFRKPLTLLKKFSQSSWGCLYIQDWVVKDRNWWPERGCEWEPIKNLLEGDGHSNKKNTATKHVSDSTTQVGQDHVANIVLLVLGTNTQPSEPKLTNTHNGNLHVLLPVLHRSDRWHKSVRSVTPVDSTAQAGSYNSRTANVPGSHSDFSRPRNKNHL